MKEGLLSRSEGDMLLKEVLQPAASRTLSDTATRFVQLFPDEGDRFRAGCALLLLLREDRGQNLSTEERVAAYYTLSVIHCSNRESQFSCLKQSPFFSALLSLIGKDDDGIQVLERKIIHHILSSGCPEALQNSHPALLIDFILGRADALPPVAEIEIGLRTSLPASRSACELHPPCIRPSPPGIPVESLDHIWLYPKSGEFLKRDASELGEDGGGWIQCFRQLLGKALQAPLLPSQKEEFVRELLARPREVVHDACTSGNLFSPADLPTLVENNPPVAVEMLKHLVGTARAGEYFAELANMEMSFHSMEVVNMLTTETEMPHEFTNLYITNCISTCQNAMDKYLQNRLVRLLCVFLQSLIRHKSVQFQDMFIEVQTFCIEFSRIKEAAALFRLLKTIEGCGVNEAAASSSSV